MGYSSSQQQQHILSSSLSSCRCNSSSSSSSSLSSCRCNSSSSSSRRPLTTRTWLAMLLLSLDILELLLCMLHRPHTLHRILHTPTYTDRLHLPKIVYFFF